MKFYRICWYPDDESEQSQDWATSRREAERIGREARRHEITEHEIEPSKAGILAALRAYAWR